MDTRWIGPMDSIAYLEKFWDLEKFQNLNLTKRQLAMNYPNSIRIISNVLCLEPF